MPLACIQETKIILKITNKKGQNLLGKVIDKTT
jgi:hypothetical protein